jgi:hypothetical protein
MSRKESELNGWCKEKRPLIYAFTSDVNPEVERKAAAVGFKKAY